jgi:hypothetical protein
MYLMTRSARLNSAAGVEWAVRILEQARSVTGNDVSLWATAYSAGFGTVTWTSWWADLTTMDAAFAGLQADATYQSLGAEGRTHIEGAVDDTLWQQVAGELDPERAGAAQCVSVVNAVCASGNAVRALTAGVEIAAKATAITGVPTLFSRGLTGPYGVIGWLSAYTSLGEFEEAQNKLAADAGWLSYLDTLDGCFVEDAAVTQQTLYRKLA